MDNRNENGSVKQLEVRHRGRFGQIGIYFGKFLRMFIYQSDWKMLPMAAIIAGLVGFALGGGFGRTMEGTLTAVFAVVCVCIWNGSFNSIQVVCRERGVVKREHRSGMYVLSYIMSHMMYQLLLCILQTVVTEIVLHLVGMKFVGRGLFTPWLLLDVGITLLLITYAADMLSLWISTLVHSTTTAMTIMPFVLIFQLIFSGGVFSIPAVVKPIALLTISNPGLKAMASQVNINDLPYSAINGMVNMVDKVEIGGKVTVGQVLDIMSDEDNPTISELRAIEVGNTMTVREVGEDLLTKDSYADLRSEELTGNITVEEAVTALMEMEDLDELMDKEIGTITTVGGVVDYLAEDSTVQSNWDEGVDIYMTVGDAIDIIGREETMAKIEAAASEAMYEPDYENTGSNIIHNWLHLLIFILVFSVLSVFTLGFIDKDKR